MAARGFEFQVAVRGGHQPHVDLLFLLAAQPNDGAFLQRAQQLALQRQWQLADLVQEDGAAVGQLEPAGAVTLRAGEGAAFVAEEFALEQRLGNGRAVHLDEGPVAARAAQVQCAREQLFARARFPQQQHAGGGRSHSFQLAQSVQQGRRGAHDAVARGRALQRQRQLFIARLQAAGGGRHQALQLQHLPGEGGQDAQDGHVVAELPVAHADAVAGQHPDGAALHLDRQRDEGHRFGWQTAARHRAKQERGLGVHVLHDGRLTRAQHAPGDAFAGSVAALRHLVAGQSVPMVDGAGRRSALGLVGQHDAAAVQAQQLAHQVQHFAQHHGGRQALADAAHHLAQQQQLLRTPVGRLQLGLGGGGVGADWHIAFGACKKPATPCSGVCAEVVHGSCFEGCSASFQL